MLYRTHVALTLLFILALVPHVTHPLVFALIALVSSFLVDIDTTNSHIGQKIYFRPLQWFVKHRGFIHSFTFCILISAVLAFFIPLAAFGFFIGFSSHLLGDALTLDGIRPFWPSTLEVKGFIRTGGVREHVVFACIGIIDILLSIIYFNKIF